MGFFSKLRELFEQGSSEPEQEVNALASAVVDSLDTALTDKQRIALLASVAAKHAAVLYWVDLLQNARGQTHFSDDYERICIYQVAIANCINALMGYYPGSSTNQSPEMMHRMQASCEFQRSRISRAILDRTKVTQALVSAMQIKRCWQDDRWSCPQDRRWQLTDITELESQAYSGSI